MAEADTQETTLESKCPPEVQEKAEREGWIPPARFRGDPARFTDADEYLRRGEEVLPIVKAQLKDTKAELENLRAVAAETKAALAQAQETLADIEARHTVDKQRAIDEAKASVKEALKRASEAGDHEAVAELTEQMVELREAGKVEEKKEEKKDEPAKTPEISPELVAWKKDNPWFETDRKKTHFAMGVAEELRANGDTSKGREFFDKVSTEVEAFFGEKEAPTSKVEGNRGSSGTRSAAGKKSFDALPAEAKAACQADTRKFVGEGKRFKTAAEWHDYYAGVYFSQE